jgi:hypothetical protein
VVATLDQVSPPPRVSAAPVAAYGVKESGRAKARAIAKTPNSVSAPNPKFQRVRPVHSIEVVRRLIEGGFLDVPRPSGQVFHDSSGCKANHWRRTPSQSFSVNFGAPAMVMRDFQELADEAFADLLQKHGRPVDLTTASRQSVGETEKRPAAPSVRRRDASRKARRGE